jgi:Trpc4-associated protein
MIPSVEKRLDSAFNDISRCVKALRIAIEAVKWIDIGHAVRILFSKVLEVSHHPEESSSTANRKREEREGFIALGGMHLLLRLFEKPFSDPDARSMSSSVINKHTELWNEVLVLLREICYSVPSLSEHLFGNKHIIFLFTLLAHRSVFENSISLLEEILAVRIDTFSLALVPNIYALISKLSTRQLAHFCRVLSLVLFEPEDRQIMEGTHVLSSLELLQLRRDRMAKASNIVERNQCLMIDMPNLLNRLLILMRYIDA